MLGQLQLSNEKMVSARKRRQQTRGTGRERKSDPKVTQDNTVILNQKCNSLVHIQVIITKVLGQNTSERILREAD